MSFIITGDTHGMLDIRKTVKFFAEHEGEYTKEDYLIILGDVGVCGFIAPEEKETRETLQNLPVMVLFIDGNHEHFDHLNAYPVDEWNGGKVHFISDDLIHLMRGQVFEIDGTKFFTFGGAYSVDKLFRTPGFSWFPQEIPTKQEYEEGWNNLEKHDWTVDYILTHAGPREVVAEIGYGELSDDERELTQYFQRIADNAEFEMWYFGHYHFDTEIEDSFRCLYDDVLVLGE